MITHDSSVNFQLMHFVLWAKRFHESTNFDTFHNSHSVMMKFCQIPHMSFSKPQVHFSSNLAWLFSVMKDNSSVLFRTKVFTLHERDESKCKLLRLFSAQIKIHQILLIFETTNRLFFKFCITLKYHEI